MVPNSKGLKVDDMGTADTSFSAKADTMRAAAVSGAACDPKGKVIRKFKGDSGARHQRNFVDAVFAHDRKKLNAEVQIGHQSTAWCNLADVAQRAGNAVYA